MDKESADRLEIRGLEVSCVIGDLPDERVNKQTLTIDATLFIDLRSAARSDSLDDTVDYAELCDNIRSGLKRAGCRMLERAADRVAFICLCDTRVKKDRKSVV